MLAQKLQSGFKKMVDFKITDTYLPGVGETSVAGPTTVQKLISASTVHPLRLWCLFPTAGNIRGAAQGNTLSTYVGRLTNAQVRINNTNYYDQPLNTDKQFYDILKSQMVATPLHEGLIDFNDFLSTYHVHCLDLTRVADRLRSPSEAVSIELDATRYDTNTCDNFYILERLQRISLNLSANETNVIVGLSQ
jgi:hypothetical protein